MNLLTDDQKHWLICRPIKPMMPAPSGSLTIYSGDDSRYFHCGPTGNWKEGFLVIGKSTHPIRSMGDYYTVRWWTSDVEFDISGFDLSYRGFVEYAFLKVFVAPFLHLKNWIKRMKGMGE